MEPKLIDAEAFEELWRLTSSPSAMQDFLRERGLFAPEPDKREAAYQAYLDRLEPGCAGVAMQFTFNAGYDAGMELRPELTLEGLKVALSSEGWCSSDAASAELYAAIIKEMHS